MQTTSTVANLTVAVLMMIWNKLCCI